MSTRRWPALLAFEMRYQGWRFTFLATVLLLAFLPFATIATGFGAPDAVNGAFVVTETMGLLSLVSVFALPMLCVHAALRDDEHGMRALVESTPVSRRMVLAVRFAGVLLLLLLALALATILLAVLPFVLPLPASVTADRLIAFRIEPYARAFALLVIPNALWCAALLFAVAAATRSTLATFVASIGIYASYIVTALMVDSPLMAGTRPQTPELLARAALLDPFGLSAFFEQTRYLIPSVRQERSLSPSGHLLQNRVSVILLAALCLAPLAWLDRRMARPRQAARRGWFARARGASDAAQDLEASPVAGRTVSASSPRHSGLRTVVQPAYTGFLAWRAAVGAVLRLETRLLLRSWPLLALLVMWILVVLIEADGQLKSGDYGTRVLASSAQLADAVPIALGLLGSVCVLYFGAEVFSRERLLRVDGIRDATPVRNSALLTGKLLALLGVPLLLTVIGYGTTVAMHLVAGGLPIEWRVLAAHAATSMLPLAIVVGTTAALQVLIGNRWVAMVAGLALLLLGAQGQALGDALGLDHPLWRFGSAPRLVWSDLSGYGPTFRSWLAFQLTWLLGTIVLLGVAAAFWPRGEVLSFGHRIRRAPRMLAQGLTPGARTTLAVCAVLYAVVLAGMTWQTTIATPFESDRAALARRAAYERRYRHLSGAAQPSFTHVAMHIALHPDRARADVHGRLHLVNTTRSPIDTLWLTFPADLSDVVVGPAADSVVALLTHTPSPALIQRAAHGGLRQVRVDSLHAVHVLVMDTPLAPGDSLPLSFALTADRGGVRAEGNAIDIVGNGTLLHSSDLLPQFGYAMGRELRDSTQRVRQGLAQPASPVLLPATAEDSLTADIHARGHSPAWFTADVRIETGGDQVAHGPGALVDSVPAHRADDRSTWHYRTTRPTTPAFVVTSGRYAVQRNTVQTARGATPVEVWYNPLHAQPASRLLEIANDALVQLEREFGDYPHDVLRIVEIPAGHRFAGYATAGSIYLTETRGMLTEAREQDVDLLLRRIGHEVAHQWWGHAVNPLDTEGRLLLVETMAKYAEQLLVEQAQGQDGLIAMLEFDHDRYMRSRHATEHTLLTMADEPELYYAKGAMAMHALRHTLGDSIVRRLVREVLTAERGPYGAASAHRFHALLRDAATTPGARDAVDEWMTRRVVYDLSVDTVMLAPVPASPGAEGRSGTRVTARFTATRVDLPVTDGHANMNREEQMTPADGIPFMLGLRDGEGQRRFVTIVAHRGVVALDTVVPWSVRSVEIDPLLYVLDRDRSNNRGSVASDASRP